jgi:hypothetical protein
MLAGINVELCKYIIQFSIITEKKKNITIESEEIYNKIIDLWRNAGSKGKRFAEIEHLEFIIDALSISRYKNAKTLSNKLEQLKLDLINQIEV